MSVLANEAVAAPAAPRSELELHRLSKGLAASDILSDVSLTVARGQIYAVLGPSGCGKTTLLRCILGLTQFSNGYIYVRSERRSDIGYMPQELGLQKDLTIEETFDFFGTINGLSKKEVATRRCDLEELLDLPSLGTTLHSLSSGQQRRVSLGVALLHDPQVLILDEPTVGLDPLLSNKIWLHLKYLTEIRDRTVIITTHYIEEAKQAHMAGLMRFGKLLEQKPPVQLLYQYKCSNLEQVFLKLAEKQDGDPDLNDTIKVVPEKMRKMKVKRRHIYLETRSAWNFHRFKAQLSKNIAWQKRNKGILVFLILLPGFLSYLCNEVLRSEVKHIPVAVVIGDISGGRCNQSNTSSNDRPREGLRLQESLCHSETARVGDVCPMDMWICNASPFSCLYLSVLSQETIALVKYSSLMEAKRSVERGKTSAVIYFNPKFSEAVGERLVTGLDTSSATIDAGALTVWIDMSNPWVGSKIKVALSRASIAFVSALVKQCDKLSHDLSIPIKMEKPVFGSVSGEFIHHALPGLLCLFCFYLPMMYTQSSVLTEKNSGQIERSMASGLSLLEMLSAHAVIQALLCMVQNVVMMSVCYLFYYNPQHGDWLLIVLLIILIEAMGTAYGLLLSVLFSSERLSTYAAVGTMVCLLGVLGVIWPYEGMHPVIRKTLWVAPVVPALQAYRAVALKGWSLKNRTVAFGLMQTSCLTVVILAASFSILKTKGVFK